MVWSGPALGQPVAVRVMLRFVGLSQVQTAIVAAHASRRSWYGSVVPTASKERQRKGSTSSVASHSARWSVASGEKLPNLLRFFY